MDVNLQNKLKEKYTYQFRNLKHIECENGWYDIIDNLCYTIENRIKATARTNPVEFEWSQIKEKFGGLRAYFNGGDDYIFGAVDLATNISYTVCEETGDKGKLRNKKISEDGKIVIANWIKTLSDETAKKYNYV